MSDSKMSEIEYRARWALKLINSLDEQLKARNLGFAELYELRDTVLPNLISHQVNQTSTKIRTFESGATRSSDEGKLDYEGFLNPFVLEVFAQYMHRHRIQEDGVLRSSDNWQKGIPPSELMKSLLRHIMELWQSHREPVEQDDMNHTRAKDALCAILFNAQAYLLHLKKD